MPETIPINVSGPACPLPIADYPQVLLAHGGGGRRCAQAAGQDEGASRSRRDVGDDEQVHAGARREQRGGHPVDRLRRAGLDDLAISDVIHAAAFFNWANRLMLSLGEPAVTCVRVQFDHPGCGAGHRLGSASGHAALRSEF